MHAKNGAGSSQDIAGESSEETRLASGSNGDCGGGSQHELLVAAAEAVLATLNGPIAKESLPRPALSALRMLAAVVANESARPT